jgi:hypothetical protein
MTMYLLAIPAVLLLMFASYKFGRSRRVELTTEQFKLLHGLAEPITVPSGQGSTPTIEENNNPTNPHPIQEA